MRHIFVSDVHLGAFDTHMNQKLENDMVALIDYCEENSIHITILGDLFDYWMEYPGFHPDLGERMLKRFSEYNQSVKSTLFITGNHDNWTTGFFKEIGFDVEPEFRIVELEGKKVFLLHGDGLQNHEYKLPRPFLHRFIRHPLFIKFYQLCLPPSYGIHMMKSFSEISRKRENFDIKRLNNWARQTLSAFPFDYIISGHDHFQRNETFPGGSYINCGPFYEERNVVFYTNQEFHLVTWNAKDKLLKPQTNSVVKDVAAI